MNHQYFKIKKKVFKTPNLPFKIHTDKTILRGLKFCINFLLGFFVVELIYKNVSKHRIHSTRTQIQKMILYSKTGFNVRFKDFWYTKINPTQIWYDKFNK